MASAWEEQWAAPDVVVRMEVGVQGRHQERATRTQPRALPGSHHVRPPPCRCSSANVAAMLEPYGAPQAASPTP
eukprot:scaffold1470_cov384-Prasinococcus_capsulatus_cf.AAC.2